MTTYRGVPSARPIQRISSKHFPILTTHVIDEDTGERIPLRGQQIAEVVGLAMVGLLWIQVGLYVVGLIF